MHANASNLRHRRLRLRSRSQSRDSQFQVKESRGPRTQRILTFRDGQWTEVSRIELEIDGSPRNSGTSRLLLTKCGFQWLRNLFSSWRGRISSFIAAFCLPEGYPDSVTHDYLTFQLFDTIQALCSYLRGTLCTQALLLGAGVGSSRDAVETATNAAVQWAFMDGAGMVGQIMFAYGFASQFGTYPKQWRFFADVINDIGLSLSLSAPLALSYGGNNSFLLVGSLGSICRALCGLAAGATRMALTQHFAQGGSRSVTADIASKEGVQETMVNLIGIVVGSWVARFSSGSQSLTWLVFIVLTIIHVWANYIAVANLCLTSLDLQRSYRLFHSFLRNPLSDEEKILSTPIQMAPLERIIAWRLPFHLDIGGPIHTALRSERELRSLVRASNQNKYLITSATGSQSLFRKIHRILISDSDGWEDDGDASIQIILHESAQSLDVLKAFFHACLMHQNGRTVNDIHMQREVDLRFPRLLTALQNAQWRYSDVSFPNIGWKCSWKL